MHLYLTGGRAKQQIFKYQEEWKLYGGGLIVHINTATGEGLVCVDYATPEDARPSANASICFKSGAVEDGLFYACSTTEVLVYRLPDFQLENYISLPCFNDLHHVTPTKWGTLLIVSTGLDLVVETDLSGKVLREWNSLGEDPWQRFSRDTDYRKVPTTKPHLSHPNFAFCLDEQVWTTRLQQKDAVCLTQPGPRIDIGVASPHDGLVCGGKIYFTTVDGRIVVADRKSLDTVEIIDLNTIDNDGGALLGWCRGILSLDGRYAWIGFSRFRHTKVSENVLWVTKALRGRPGIVDKPTRIALYDLHARKCIQEIDTEPFGLHAIFSIHPA